MAEQNSKQSAQYLPEAYIEDPRILAEQILTEDILNGSITFPIHSTDTSGESKIVTVPFSLEGDFNFSLGNEWGQIVPEGVGNMLSMIGTLISLSGYDKERSNIQYNLASKAMSVACWNGSKTPNFSITVSFVATRRSYNPVEIIKALSATCLPLTRDDLTQTEKDHLKSGNTTVATGIKWTGEKITKITPDSVDENVKQVTNQWANLVQNAVLIAPLKYAPEIDYNNDSILAESVQDCTVTLNIGRWFSASQLIVTDISNITFSREVIAPQPDWLYNSTSNALYAKNKTPKEKQGNYGFPLYAKCTIGLKPIKMITYTEFCKYFQSTTPTSTTSNDVSGTQIVSYDNNLG